MQSSISFAVSSVAAPSGPFTPTPSRFVCFGGFRHDLGAFARRIGRAAAALLDALRGHLRVEVAKVGEEDWRKAVHDVTVPRLDAQRPAREPLAGEPSPADSPRRRRGATSVEQCRCRLAAYGVEGQWHGMR